MTDRPNVLLVCTDHWPGYLLGAAGHPIIQTPTLDQLAENGVLYSRAYSSCPVCIPARRSQMTGTYPRTHGDRLHISTLRMPPLPTLAQTFRDAGYQTYAVGKLHVYPQRDRIGFDDVILAEEGRMQWGVTDDYEAFLGEEGYAGQQFWHGMGSNSYITRPWHLPEYTHITNWTTQQMARQIKRRDPTRPGFWYLSYSAPHPPLVPLQAYLDLYDPATIREPVVAEWAGDVAQRPAQFGQRRFKGPGSKREAICTALRAFYALCTHVDHQLRVVIGTLLEEGLLDNTIILFHSDHGDMLGEHGLWAKRAFYEPAARIPMILVDTRGSQRAVPGSVDDRLVTLEDIMPTLLDLAGIAVPDTVEGLSMVGPKQRQTVYGEYGEGSVATRMVLKGWYKLIYYPLNHQIQLFDVQDDPHESTNLAQSPGHAHILEDLLSQLTDELYGTDRTWLRDGILVGLDGDAPDLAPDRYLTNQRGTHWPPPQGAIDFT
jgi:arylsulfatase